MYDALNHGLVEPGGLRATLASLPLPRASDGRIVLAVDVSPWLRSDAATSAQRLFCHVYDRAHSASQLIPGWPYSFVAALEPGRTSAARRDAEGFLDRSARTVLTDITVIASVDEPQGLLTVRVTGTVLSLVPGVPLAVTREAVGGLESSAL